MTLRLPDHEAELGPDSLADIAKGLACSIAQLESLVASQRDEIERLRIPVCVGKPIIGILARNGAWQSENGQALIAADELFRADPYAENARLRAALASADCPGGGWNGMPKGQPATVALCVQHGVCGCDLGRALDRVVPESHCPACGKRLDRAVAMNADAAPEPGDITICIGCGHLMAFAEDLQLRELTDDEIKEIAGDKRVLAAQRARRYAQLGIDPKNPNPDGSDYHLMNLIDDEIDHG